MKQKPVPLPRPQPEKQPQQFKKKESPVDEIRAKVNEVKELASKSDLVMQGHLEQVLMKLSLLEKDIENDKKNLTAQMGKNSRLEKQLKEANEKIQKLSNSNMDKNLNSNLQTHIPLFPPPTSSFSNRQSSSNIPIKNVPVFSPPHGMTPPVPKHQTEKHLEDVLHNNLTLLEQNDRLQKQIEALQKKSY
uniref:Uncharacterized protein n=1 Tax=Acrobeloides nanus TaxID=290746 RepID=A0A914DQZ7_9BILA